MQGLLLFHLHPSNQARLEYEWINTTTQKENRVVPDENHPNSDRRSERKKYKKTAIREAE